MRFYSLLTCMRPRRGKCRCCMLLFIVFVTIMGGVIFYKAQEMKCDDVETKKMIDDICSQYKNNSIAGSYCPVLCDKQLLQYNSCASYHAGKDVVFLTCPTCGATTQQMVMKRRKYDVDEQKELFSDVAIEKTEVIEMLVHDIIQHQKKVSIAPPEDIVSYAWGYDFNQYIHDHTDVPNAVGVAAASIMSLMHQFEYVLAILIKDYTFMPKVYGTCGSSFFVEYTDSLDKMQFWFTYPKVLWTKQVKVALKLIDLMLQLESSFQQELHLCDIKADNFGLRHTGEVTLIDTDCAMFHEDLVGQFQFMNCTKHEDCDFFDCKGICDISTRKCHLDRANNNMQSLCEDVFLDKIGPLSIGLLREPPPGMRRQLTALLMECAYPGGEVISDRSRAKTKKATVKKLIHLLRESLT